MFLKCFNLAYEHMRNAGRIPYIKIGSSVVAADLDVIDIATDHLMPSELRAFYLELGDAFEFIPDSRLESLTGWQATWLGDYEIHNCGFFHQIEEEALSATSGSLEQRYLDLLRIETEARKQWIPFYGFTGGGDLLCLDRQGGVRFYESLSWCTSPQTWSFLLAESFADFVTKWSRYCFVTPGSSWASFCMGRTGVFDWAPEHFPGDAMRS